MTIDENAYRAALDADNAWQAALVAAYGTAAGNNRYNAKGAATPALAALKSAKIAADAVVFGSAYGAWIEESKPTAR